MKLHRFITTIATTATSLIILVMPVSDNYSLRELDFGAGGGIGQSANYSFEGILSEQGAPMSGTTYDGGLGFGFTQMSFVPQAPTLTNPDNFYDKLHLTIDPSGNPSDTLFAIAISNDNFATSHYVKADQSIGTTLTMADYGNYSSWGGSSGFHILGLQPGTSYQVKIKALHGNFSESPFGPTASASTVNPSLSFDIDIAATDTTSAPPHRLHIGTLLADTITTANDKVWLSLSTNANHGGSIYVVGQHGALQSSSRPSSIPSLNADLASASQGFGIRGDSLNAAGSDLAFSTSFDLTGEQIAAIPTLYQTLASSSQPLLDGRLSLVVKAKADNQTIAAQDYQEILTIVAAANY